MQHVLLIYGLGRTPFSLFRLATVVRQSGYCPSFFGYSSTIEPMLRIVARLKLHIERVQPTVILAHSLGGILTRLALTQTQLPSLKQIVMIGTPNQPPRLAKWFMQRWWFRIFAASCGEFLASAEAYQQLPTLPCDVTIFAGTAGPCGKFSPFGVELNDSVVSVSETKLNEQTEPILIPALHSFMMNHPMVSAGIHQLLSLEGVGLNTDNRTGMPIQRHQPITD
jgi:pimeloyl-ACP methyl ester carboxylesterase